MCKKVTEFDTLDAVERAATKAALSCPCGPNRGRTLQEKAWALSRSDTACRFSGLT